MSPDAAVLDLTPALRESTQLELGKLRGLAKAEFDLAEEMRDIAAKFTELAERHYARHVRATEKADDISLKLRRSGS